MKRFLPQVVILVISIFAVSRAQVVFEPINSGVYSFLGRLATEQIISVNDEVKPYTRVKIGRMLLEAESKTNMLNKVQREELAFFEEEFAHEMNLTDERWFLYKYSDTLFNFRLSPFAGYGISTTGDQSGHTRWWGFSTYAEVSDWLGASFSYKDIGQFGGNIDVKKDFTPERGYYINAQPKDGIEFSDVTGSINFNWKWGSISLIKDNIQWGHGKFGQLIFSDKVESYPQIRLYFNPAKWIRFYYMHGWLNSLVIDSAATYYSHFESVKPVVHKQYYSKFVAGNLLSITPVEDLDVSVGNSVIYSGNLRPEMFIPFLYYKVMDHNTGRNEDDANGQIFFDVSSRNLKGFQFYSTLFIDGFSITKTLNNNYRDNELGYTFGMTKVNFPLDNLDITLEYSRLNPFVYEHKYQTEDFKHINFYLGHWLGQNADQIKFQFNYKPMRELEIIGSFEKLRKAGLSDINAEYSSKIQPPSFMWGPLRKDYNFKIEGKWEPYHDAVFDIYYNYSSISDQQKNRTPAFLLGDINSAGITVSYGL